MSDDKKIIDLNKKKNELNHTVDTGLSIYDANKQIMEQLIESGQEHELNPMEQAAIQPKNEV